MALRSLTEGLASESDLEQIAALLLAILNRIPLQDIANAAIRVNAIGGSLASVTTLSNQTQQGALFTNNDQQVQFALAAAQNRNKLTVT
jgi:hypothetical protein